MRLRRLLYIFLLLALGLGCRKDIVVPESDFNKQVFIENGKPENSKLVVTNDGIISLVEADSMLYVPINGTWVSIKSKYNKSSSFIYFNNPFFYAVEKIHDVHLHNYSPKTTNLILRSSSNIVKIVHDTIIFRINTTPLK